MLSFIKALGTAFRPATFSEIHGDLDNPGRGWYRIYTYRIGEPWEEPVRYPGESLALVLIDIGAFRGMDLTPEALAEMEGILGRFEDLGFDLILRICYDTEGKGMVREPSLFSQVKKHMEQIAPMLRKHAGRIFVCQGVLIGNWGEMHESKFLSPAYLSQLANVFLNETNGEIPVAFRKPVQYRIAFSESQPRPRIGFFNDGMLGSETHLGTFGPETAGKGAWNEAWSPAEEIGFMAPFVAEVPYGGEAVTAGEALSANQVTDAMRALKTSYLNSMHDAALLASWKELTLDGMSLHAFIGERLGYRFLVGRVRAKLGKKLELWLTVENAGFGTLYDDASLRIYGRFGEEAPFEIGVMEGSLRGIPGGTAKEFYGAFEAAQFQTQGKNEGLKLYARIQRSRDGREIRFAQGSGEEELFLGRF